MYQRRSVQQPFNGPTLNPLYSHKSPLLCCGWGHSRWQHICDSELASVTPRSVCDYGECASQTTVIFPSLPLFIKTNQTGFLCYTARWFLSHTHTHTHTHIHTHSNIGIAKLHKWRTQKMLHSLTPQPPRRRPEYARGHTWQSLATSHSQVTVTLEMHRCRCLSRWNLVDLESWWVLQISPSLILFLKLFPSKFIYLTTVTHTSW